ncbi:rhamnogalacturonan acetylesterase [Formosa sp. 4Alg 33]|uniref:rhamnogalacturonan acetylesterase n=1 Tax=Formosa sp. 4Alg 33 TaxID=3382189 RepID=UPI003D9C3563
MTLYRILIVFFIFAFPLHAQQQPLPKVFKFGDHKTNNSEISISKSIVYTEALGYGFDFNTGKHINFTKTGISGIESTYFSVKLSEGDYKVDVILGGDTPSKTTIKAESKRLMLREIQVPKNKSVNNSFAINVRTPKISDTTQINIKDREKNSLNWDDKLTLEFLGDFEIQSITITPITKITIVFLAGDSTVTDQNLEPWASWGQLITNYFTDDIVIANYAQSGASLPSFKARHRLDKILSLMKKGDYLFIEFGHNDEKIKAEGNGAWGLYTNLLKEFVTKARDKSGIPVLVTPTQRRAFDTNGKLKPTHGDFPNAMRKVATDLQVPLIDITKMTTKMYEAWGEASSRKAFVQYPANTFPGQTKALEDNTHFNSFGANEIAKAVLLGIQNLNLELSKYIIKETPKYNPNQPDQLLDWTVPMSGRFENETPDGN